MLSVNVCVCVWYCLDLNFSIRKQDWFYLLPTNEPMSTSSAHAVLKKKTCLKIKYVDGLANLEDKRH